MTSLIPLFNFNNNNKFNDLKKFEKTQRLYVQLEMAFFLASLKGDRGQDNTAYYCSPIDWTTAK